MHVEIQKFIQWLRCKNPHTSTHIHYGNDLELFFAWVNKSLAAITVSGVDTYITHCQAQGHTIATVNRRGQFAL
jgi:site-specific recombinase XerD